MKQNTSNLILLLIALSGPFVVNLDFSLVNFSNRNNFKKNKISYFENKNSFRKNLINSLEVIEKKQSKIHPNNFEPQILIEKLGHVGKISLSETVINNPIYPIPNKIIGEIKSSISKDFWQDINYFLDGQLIFTKRCIYNLSSENNYLEGILNLDNSITTFSNEKYWLVKINGLFRYEKN